MMMMMLLMLVDQPTSVLDSTLGYSRGSIMSSAEQLLSALPPSDSTHTLRTLL